MSNKIFLTQEGLKKLEDELLHLKEVRRVEIAAKLKEAISFGDLSENSEYEDARSEQAQVELRISDIEDQLKNIEIIVEKKGKTDKVTMGSVIILQAVGETEKVEYKIVGSTESDILADIPKISNDSPAGSAALGKKKGDTIKVQAQSGALFEYKILEVK